MRILSALLAAAVLTAGMPLSAAARDNAKAEARLAKALEGRVAGKPVDCINLRDIQSSEIIDRTAILYRTSGGRLYVNRPQIGAESLERDDILVVRTWDSRLCSIDTIRLVDQGSRFERGFVGLGSFVPYAKAAAAD